MTMEHGTGPQVRETEVDRYRRAERLFWREYGLSPAERFVRAGSPSVHLRVQRIGSGEPVLFVHGTGGPGAYFAPVVRELRGFSCLLLDRPGWGLSSPTDYSRGDYGQLVAELVRDTLDALEIEKAHVLGGSIGDLWALRFAQRFPERVRRIVLMGGGPLTPDIRVPTFIRLLRSPLGNVIIRIPEKRATLRKQLVGLGHRASLEAGRIPDAFLNWHTTMSRETEWARHERQMVKSIVGPQGFKSGVVLQSQELRALEPPVLMVYGTNDTAGSPAIWQRFTDGLAHGELELIEDGGHLVWFDAPERIGARVRSFLEE